MPRQLMNTVIKHTPSVERYCKNNTKSRLLKAAIKKDGDGNPPDLVAQGHRQPFKGSGEGRRDDRDLTSTMWLMVWRS